MTSVKLAGWEHRVGQRVVWNGEDLGRAAAVHYDHEARQSEIEVVPELLYWSMVTGGLVPRTLPGHEPGIPTRPCKVCAGAGRLANLIDRRIIPVTCWHCDGWGREPTLCSLCSRAAPCGCPPGTCRCRCGDCLRDFPHYLREEFTE